MKKTFLLARIERYGREALQLCQQEHEVKSGSASVQQPETSSCLFLKPVQTPTCVKMPPGWLSPFSVGPF